MELGSRAKFVAVLLTGIVGTGLVVMALTSAGYSMLGTVAWIVGYGAMIVVLWAGWIRPLDFRGATNPGGDGDERDRL